MTALPARLALVSEDAVAAPVRCAAAMGVAEACRRLSLPPPRMCWFAASTGVLGFAEGGAIFLRASQSPRSAFETAAHEARHLLQQRCGHSSRPTTAGERRFLERDAEAFAMRLRRSGFYDSIQEEG